MKGMKGWKRWMMAVMAAAMLVGAVPSKASAAEVRVYSDKIQRGKTGKNMTVSFTVRNNSGSDINDLKIGFDTSGGEIWDEDEEDMQYGYSFPFEVTDSLPSTDHPKSAGKLADGKEKTVSLTGTVRRDLTEGYYKVPVVVMRGENEWIGNEDLRVWITKSTSDSDDEDDEIKSYDFVLGEGQSTPYGVYPEVMNFSINLRNNSPATVYNIKAALVPDADSAKFPFEINDVNYDRMFEKISVNETVPLDYSFAIREDVYSGYYLINMKISYSKSSTGDELQTYETSFYVHVKNKDKEDEYEEFNEHDRTKARLIVDGFSVSPEKITAGEPFDLSLTLKNASSSVSASDILLSVESEKVSDSPVFTTDSGSSSVAVSSLGAGQTTQVSFRLLSRAGVDQRSYSLTIKAAYDSPEFKNAEDSMSVDIPIYQIPRLNTGTFEITPESIRVGEESNVMFGINNTGKVQLYNVMVQFQADSIQTVDTYVGNIKPGETGNVDCMIEGAAPTADDGTIQVIISYEDENGAVSQVEKTMTLMVTEDTSAMDDMEAGNFDDTMAEEPGFFARHKTVLILAAIGAAAAAAVAAVLWIRRRKRKKDEDGLEDEDES